MERRGEMCAAGGPLVSVVIPTRNRAALLRRAIASVLRQTYPNLDIVVVDDASNDNTAQAVLSGADPRIRYVRHDVNRGGAAARNTGIRMANGEFIAFLDDDDVWEPLKTELHLKEFRDYEVVLCAADIGGSDSRPRTERVSLAGLRRGEFTAGGTSTLMAKTTILREIMFDESLPRYQDWDLYIRIAQRYEIGYLDKPLVRYNGGAHERITTKARTLPIGEAERQFRMLGKHREFFGTLWFRRHMARSLLNGVRHRSSKVAYVGYVAGKYGVLNTLWALGKRLRARWRRSSGSVGLADG